MSKAVKYLNQYKQLHQREAIVRFLGNTLGSEGLIVATNDIKLAASILGGTAETVNGYALSDAALIKPATGLPKLYVSPSREDYRKIFDVAFRSLGIESAKSFFASQDIDHALAKSLAIEKFDYVLLNPVDKLANRSHGSFEKDSKLRTYKDALIEIASITDILKICEIAPVSRGNLALDCLIGVISAREAGLLSRSEFPSMIDMIRNSSSNIVREEYERVKDEFEEAVRVEA